jgi:hypothetical protein
MVIDPLLPFSVFPAVDGERYVVSGRRVGALVEISLTVERRQGHRFGPDTYTPIEDLAVGRFPH